MYQLATTLLENLEKYALIAATGPGFDTPIYQAISNDTNVIAASRYCYIAASLLKEFAKETHSATGASGAIKAYILNEVSSIPVNGTDLTVTMIAGTVSPLAYWAVGNELPKLLPYLHISSTFVPPIVTVVGPAVIEPLNSFLSGSFTGQPNSFANGCTKLVTEGIIMAADTIIVSCGYLLGGKMLTYVGTATLTSLLPPTLISITFGSLGVVAGGKLAGSALPYVNTLYKEYVADKLVGFCPKPSSLSEQQVTQPEEKTTPLKQQAIPPEQELVCLLQFNNATFAQPKEEKVINVNEVTPELQEMMICCLAGKTQNGTDITTAYY